MFDEPPESLADQLGLGSRELVSFVGGGGKTTLLFELGATLPGTIVLTTTTKMGSDRTHGLPVLVGPDDAAIGEALVEHRTVLAWAGIDGHKALGFEPARVDRFHEIADHVLVEADGARRLPFKAPAPYEPVVPSRSTLVVAVIGSDALGHRIDEVCHRPERVAGLLGCGPERTLEPAMAAEVLTHTDGSRRGVPRTARFAVAITKVRAGERRDAEDLARHIADRGVEAVVVDWRDTGVPPSSPPFASPDGTSLS